MSSYDDRLSTLLDRFPLHAGIFHRGPACGTFDFDRWTRPGHFHLVRSGRAELSYPDGGVAFRIDEPSLVYLPDAETHRLVCAPGVELLCATVRFGTRGTSAVVGALPPLVVIKLAESSRIASLGDLMSEEMHVGRPGQRTSLNRLCELAVVALLRICLERGLAKGGALAALTDARLSAVLQAIHQHPARDWSLDDLARLAGMSRARFASHFRQTIGLTPGDHIASCRIARAQELLRQGLPLKGIAAEVGYGSASAFARAFSRLTGTAPGAWRSRGVADT